MTRQEEQKATFTRRAMILAACKVGLMTGLLGRMFYLQILSNENYSKLSEKNSIKREIIPPLRGRILDRNDLELATNKQSYQVILSRNALDDMEHLQQVCIKIAEILNFTAEQRQEIFEELSLLKTDEELVLAEGLSWNDLAKLELRAPDLPGSNIEIGFERFYPFGSLCGHLTGYIGKISTKEKSAQIIHTNFKIGKNGIEKTFEQSLHGVPGENKVEVNAKGEVVDKISAISAIAGKDVNLSIDLGLQRKAAELLKNITGVVMVAKLSSGEILASVSNPSFDPNLFNHGISLNNWNNLINNPELPLIDRSVALTYPPGSGFKINVAIAALKLGFNPETRFSCPGTHQVGNRAFHCWNKTGHGSVNLFEAIAGSCNVYFWNVARRIGVQPIADTARELGYGTKLLNGSLPREQAGIIPDPEWKQKNIGTSWTLADTINTAIGQGYVEATPVQILTMISRIATGTKIIPTIIKSEDKTEFAALGLEKELKIIRQSLEMVVNSNKGTAFAARINIADFAMAGKTGTSQVISKRHKNDDLSHASVSKAIKNHGIFVGYAPLINPQYSYCGIIEHGGAPLQAIKIANELLTKAQLDKL